MVASSPDAIGAAPFAAPAFNKEVQVHESESSKAATDSRRFEDTNLGCRASLATYRGRLPVAMVMGLNRRVGNRPITEEPSTEQFYRAIGRWENEGGAPVHHSPRRLENAEDEQPRDKAPC